MEGKINKKVSIANVSEEKILWQVRQIGKPFTKVESKKNIRFQIQNV